MNESVHKSTTLLYNGDSSWELQGQWFFNKESNRETFKSYQKGDIPFSNKLTFIILLILYNSMALRCHLLLLSFEDNQSFTINFRARRRGGKCHRFWNFFSNTKIRDAVLRLKCSEKTSTKFVADKTLSQQLKRETVISCANRP